MGLLAFYGGLLMGTLVGMVIISLAATSLRERKFPELPDRPDEYFHDHADFRGG
jgi:hypothetical protein